MKTCRVIFEGPPFDGVELQWPIGKLGLPKFIVLTYEVAQDFPPSTRREGQPAGTQYPAKYKLAARPTSLNESDPIASYASLHDMKRYGPTGEDPLE